MRIGQRVIPAEPRPYTDGISGETVWTYHARVGGLRPGATYAYAVTADNDSNGGPVTVVLPAEDGRRRRPPAGPALNLGPHPYQGCSVMAATCCDPGRQACRSARE